jgi:hypothetical protein
MAFSDCPPFYFLLIIMFCLTIRIVGGTMQRFEACYEKTAETPSEYTLLMMGADDFVNLRLNHQTKPIFGHPKSDASRNR